MKLEESEDEMFGEMSKALGVDPEKLRRGSEEARAKICTEYEEKDPGYAFGLFSLLHMWESTGRASLRLTRGQVNLIYDALAFVISSHLPLPFKPSREPYEVILGGDAVLRLMTDEDYDHSARIDHLKGVVECLSIMMLIEEQIKDCQTWPCAVELDGYSLTAVSSALTAQAVMEYLPGSPILELNRATKKLIDDTITMMP